MTALLEKERAKQQLLDATVELEPVTTTASPSKDISLSPENLTELIDQLKLSIRSVAGKMSMSHSTLVRYINKEGRRYNKGSMDKIQDWYERIKIDK